ncbi:hypothetical protein [Pendulispora albinea]|uniref:Uncharacterized protein n=1 Tax=Pendulispora albinea TaxID=2741071 RepID=A0ABZ2LYH4_9BACT
MVDLLASCVSRRVKIDDVKHHCKARRVPSRLSRESSDFDHDRTDPDDPIDHDPPAPRDLMSRATSRATQRHEPRDLMSHATS